MLKDLNELGLNAKQKFLEYDNQEIELSKEFKEKYVELFYKDSKEEIRFARYTTLVETESDLTITFPNQWFYIATYFTEFHKALKEYKNIYNEIFTTIDKWKEVTKSIKTTGEIPADIEEQIKLKLDQPSQALFRKFISDYKWWFGSKTIDRGDYFVSPILGLAGVVNVSQSYIAHLVTRLSKYDELVPLLQTSLIDKTPPKKVEKTIPVQLNVGVLKKTLNEVGLNYADNLISSFVSAALTKPFIILTGLSGSGKTKLAQAFAQWICNSTDQYKIIPVGADWTNREPLLGFPNALNPKEYVKPDSGALDLILRANENPESPHFLILDEMNLSHVERYFADFLSVMESGDDIPLYSEGAVDNDVPAKLKIPANLFIIGTVNIDETTNMFSPKVLDRANTIEFRISSSEMESFLGSIREIDMDALTAKGASMAASFLELSRNKRVKIKDQDEINKSLIKFFGELKKAGAEFGYRTGTEILRLINQLSVIDNTLDTNTKLDIAIMQKLLPKLHGSRRKLVPVLTTLASFCVAEGVNIEKDVFEKEEFDFEDKRVNYPLSLEKITRMHKGAIENGFASFAEA